MSESKGSGLSRKQRRERTEGVILDAAKKLFSEHGFDRTTIRAVAAEAGVDPALVMQYFDSKDGLFVAAALSTVDTQSLVQADRGELPRTALEHVFTDFEDPERRASAVALLRSAFTHPKARQMLRDKVTATTQSQVADTIGGEDAAIRAALLNACMLGLTVARYLLEDPVLKGAGRREIARVLEPALQEIVKGQGLR